MNVNGTFLPYQNTNSFSSLVIDYINEDKELDSFYKYPVSVEGLKAAIKQREKFTTDRKILTDVFKEQYQATGLSNKQQFNIQHLNNENCFTICTAHQPNIFTGHLYFIYKIIHAIKLADELNKEIPEATFVPVYYMGSEDADLDELGHVYLNGEKYQWQTKQTGAIGRMVVDKSLIELIDKISGQLLIHSFGKELIDLLRICYKLGSTISEAIFKLVNTLFSEYGLLVLEPDNTKLKSSFVTNMKDELLNSFSNKAVKDTANAFPSKYKMQATGREINLFYLEDTSRERIEKNKDEWKVVNTSKVFLKDEIINELNNHPEKFSPNVILRPLLQEMILPNVAFIGGGGEVAYWLELKKVFEVANIPYPLLVLRNSFLLLEEKHKELQQKLQLSNEDLFQTELDLLNIITQRNSAVNLTLVKEIEQFLHLYGEIKNAAGKVDSTLQEHVTALQTKAAKKIEALEKKMLKAERKKYEAEQRQIAVLKKYLFPNSNLQERVENFMPYYAKWGSAFIQTIYNHSLTLQQQFCIVHL